MDIYVYTDKVRAAAEFHNLKQNVPAAALIGPEPFVAVHDALNPDDPDEVHMWSIANGPYWIVISAESEIVTSVSG